MAGVAKLTVGTPEADCDITPVVSESSANFIEGLVMDAKVRWLSEAVLMCTTQRAYAPHAACAWAKLRFKRECTVHHNMVLNIVAVIT